MKKKKTAIDVLNDNIETKNKKSKDYQGNGITEEMYFPYGHKSYLHMLNTKILRIKSIYKKNPHDVEHESIIESLKDLSVYAAMYSAALQNGTVEEEE